MTSRGSTGSLLPILLLLRQSQALFPTCRHHQVFARSLSLTKVHVLASSATATSTKTTSMVRTMLARTIMSSTGSDTGEDRGSMGGDVRERAQAMHSNMPSEGKEDMLRQANREAHNRRQAAVFNAKADFFSSPQATPPEQFPSLRRIAEACLPAGDGSNARRVVVDVGCGTGALAGFLKEVGLEERRIVGVDMASEMGSVFHERYPKASVIVSEFVDYAAETIKLREVQEKRRRNADHVAAGDATDKGVESSVATVVFNAVFGNLWDQGAALESAAAILEEGGKVVISHPLGRNFVSRLKAVDATVVPHDLPERDELDRLVQFLPFRVESFESSRDLYLAILRKTPYRALEVVSYLRGEVSQGYGRGGKELGIPTANLPESQFSENLSSLPAGVYMGWATLEGGTSEEPWKCVANVGYSPTFTGKENPEKIVEGHLIDYRGGDFYGKTMRLLLAGFQRSETKFASFPELVTAINKDVADAAAGLDDPRFAVFRDDAFFSLGTGASDARAAPEAWSTKDFLSAMRDARRTIDD